MNRPSSLGRRQGRRNFNQARFNGPRNRGGGRNNQPVIDYRRFINQSTTPAEFVEYQSTHRFSDFAFDTRLKEAVAKRGYITPTAIQDQAIPHVLAGRDLVGIANTGTGKTASFILPIINQLLSAPHDTALIMTPTRELASQIDDEFRLFAAGLKLYSAVCVGGVREGSQIAALKRHPQVVIGTPGRLKQFITEGRVPLDRCRTFVLDEADRMLDMGFIKDMEFIISHLPTPRQSLCLSATITADVQRIMERLLINPVTVSVRTRETSEHIDQNVIHVGSREEKLAHLERLLKQPDYDKVLIFGETKHGVQRLSEKLTKQGISASAIHGNKNQNQRQRALDAFKAGRTKVLVATDVAARGLDVPSVSHVINYDPPKAYEDYIHRIGRTGRAGNRGSALTFVPHAS